MSIQISQNALLYQAYLKLNSSETEEAKNAALEEVNTEREKAGLQPLDKAAVETGPADETKGQLSNGAYKLAAEIISTDWSAFGKDKKTEADIDKIIQEMQLMSKYNTTQSFSGDIYSMDNPQMKKFQQFLSDGIIAQLAEKGCTRNDIVDIVAKVFPNIGISRQDKNSDEFTLPKGHPVGSEATQTYKGEFTNAEGKQVEGFLSQLAAASASSPELVKAESELKEMINRYNVNVSSLLKIRSDIDMLSRGIEQDVDNAIAAVKRAQQEAQDKAKKISAEKVSEYKNSNGSMSYEEFRNGLSAALSEVSPEMSDSVRYMNSAEQKMSSIKSFARNITNLNDMNAGLKQDIDAKNAEIDALRIAEQEKTKEDANLVDPIGFNLENGDRVDFFIDKDNNNGLSNEKEFLGAENGWNEMTALDTNGADGKGDGRVDKNEMSSAGLKVVITHQDGTQEIKNAAEYFQDDDSIDLSSYIRNGNKMEGTDNILEGTFTANIGGKSVEGHNTLDTLSWLDENYAFTDEAEGKGRFSQGTITTMAADPNITAESYDSKITQLQTKINTGWRALGVDFSIDTLSPGYVEPQNPGTNKLDMEEIENLIYRLPNSPLIGDRESIIQGLLSKLGIDKVSDSDKQKLNNLLNEVSSKFRQSVHSHDYLNDSEVDINKFDDKQYNDKNNKYDTISIEKELYNIAKKNGQTYQPKHTDGTPLTKEEMREYGFDIDTE